MAVCLLLPFPACARDEDVPAEGPGEAETADVPADGGEDMNPYSYLGPGYAFKDGILTASPTAKDNAEERFAGAFAETEPENYSAEITLTLDSLHSSAGLLFAASESSSYDGVEGYAFMIRDKRVYLYDLTGSAVSGLMPKELASKSVERPKTGAEIRLRVDKDGKTHAQDYLNERDVIRRSTVFPLSSIKSFSRPFIVSSISSRVGTRWILPFPVVSAKVRALTSSRVMS